MSIQIFMDSDPLLEKKFLNDRSVEVYSKMLNANAGFLNKICRQLSGLSSKKIVHHKLISEIKKQLYQNKSAKEIPYQLGFSDPSNFNRFFKKFTDTTHQQDRRNT